MGGESLGDAARGEGETAPFCYALEIAGPICPIAVYR